MNSFVFFPHLQLSGLRKKLSETNNCLLLTAIITACCCQCEQSPPTCQLNLNQLTLRPLHTYLRLVSRLIKQREGSFIRLFTLDQTFFHKSGTTGALFRYGQPVRVSQGTNFLKTRWPGQMSWLCSISCHSSAQSWRLLIRLGPPGCQIVARSLQNIPYTFTCHASQAGCPVTGLDLSLVEMSPVRMLDFG